MDIAIQIIIMLLFIVVFVQDLKFRAIHMLLPIGIIILGFVAYFRNGHHYLGLVYNLVFLVITFSGLYLYLSIKKKNFKNPFKQTMGLGDLLFFIAVIPFFSTYNYILFFISGMIFSIIGFLLIKLFNKTDLVPLAGLLALYIALLKIGQYSTGIDIFFTKII